MASLLVLPLAWVIAFLAPVLPIVARSELYLYLPVFGLCLLAGLLAQALIWNVAQRRTVAVVVAVYVVTLGAYQIVRARDIQRDLAFSEQLVAALRSNTQLLGTQSRVLLIPSDPATERSLQNAIGGYLYLLLQHAFPGSTPRAGAVQYTGAPPYQADVRLLCAFRANEVVISRTP